MAENKIKSITDQRKFTLVYNDFLESNLLNYYEKMIFITLKKFADNNTLKAFPSLNTLHEITGISLSQIKRSLKQMQKLGVISIEHRTDKENGHRSNIYTLYDYAEKWQTNKKIEDITAKETSEAEMIAILRAKGYKVTKEKAPETSDTDQSNDDSSTYNQNSNNYSTINSGESQELERYSLEDVKTFYNYDVMINDYPHLQNKVDSIIAILYECLNTTKKTIRVNKEEKATMVVINKLMKLTYSEILYVIEKYTEKTERIERPTSYIITLLYNAKEQMQLDITNQVQYDFYNPIVKSSEF